MDKNLYDILGVKKTASEKEIQKAYKKLALKYHPDKQVGKSDEEKKKAEEVFKEAAMAYDVLNDKEKRQQYDMFGTVGGSPNMGGYGNSNPFSGGGFPFGFEDLFGYGRRSGGSGRSYAPGADARMRIPLTIEEVYSGCKKTVKYKKNVRCSHCHGDGGTGKKVCPNCGGTGQVMNVQQTAFGIAQQITTCRDCKGTGYIVEKKCTHCSGTGFTQKDSTVTIEFPAGIQNGNGIQVPGAGHEAKDSHGSNGNFLAVVDYAFKEDEYEVSNYNVRQTVHVPYYDMLLGSEIEIKLPDGRVRKINLDECTPHGKQIRLYKDGISGHGDYYLTIVGDMPSTLSVADKAALEQIRINNKKK